MTDETNEIPFLITLGEQLAERAARDEEALARGGRFRRWRGERARRSDLRGRRGWALGGTAVAAALVAVVLALSVDFGGGDHGGHVVAPTPATAQAFLTNLARTAQAQPNAMPGPGQLFYVHSLTTRLQSGRPPTAGNTDITTYDRRIWTSPAKGGRLYETAITKEPLLGGRKVQLGDPDAPQQLAPTGGYRIGRVRLRRAGLLAFPTTPERIVARMRAAQPGATTADLFEGIAGALRESPAPPALRAGLYQALGRLPGVTLIGAVKDPRGRAAVAIGLDGGDGTRSELLLDPDTAEILAERVVLTDPATARSPLPAGTTLTSTVYLHRVPVDAISDQ